MSSRIQNTISQPVSIHGFGYWSGLDVSVEFRPAAENSGITFVRRDSPQPIRIPARFGNRTQAQRRTSICRNGATVEMIEHIMAALSGLHIDNCEIWVDRAEMPGFDGSAQTIVEALDVAGIQPQSLRRKCFKVTRPLRVDDERGWIEIVPADRWRLTYHLDYPNSPSIGRQSFDLEITPTTFRRELAGCRTFLLQSEADWLRSQGLGHRVSYQQLLVFGEDGPIDNQLRYENECARHKALDIVGDMALCGFDIAGHLTASRSGHRLNSELVKLLIEQDLIEQDLNDQDLIDQDLLNQDLLDRPQSHPEPGRGPRPIRESA